MTSPGGKGFEIAQGYVEVTVDGDKADRQILKFFRDTELKLAALEASMAKHGEQGGEEFGLGVTKGARRELGSGFFRDVNGRLRDAKGRFTREGEESGRLFGIGFTRGVGRETSRGRGIFGAIFAGIGAIGSAFAGAFSALASFGSKIGDVGSKLGDFAGKVGDVFSAVVGFAKVGLIAAAIPAVLGLGGALLDLIPLLLLLPGLIAGLLATILPLVVAFKGMGDAISAMVSGDLDKFNEALKKLAPSAQRVLKEIKGLLPQLRNFGKVVQEAFFKPLVGAFTPLVKFLFPTLQQGFATVSGALGRFVRQFLDLLSANDIVKDIGKLFASVGKTIDMFTPTAIKLFGTLFGIMEHGLPFIERAFAVLNSGLGKFADWLSQAMKTGDFDRMLESAFATLKDLWELTKAIGSLIGALFGDAGDEGRNFIQNITIAVQRLADFLRTAEGKESLQTLLDTLKSVGVAVVALGEAIAFTFKAFQFFADALEAVVGWVKSAWDWLKKLWGVITEGASDVVGWLQSVGRWFADLGSTVWGFIRGAGSAIAGWFTSVVEFFKALPGRILEAIMALPGEISRIGQAAFDAFFRAIGFISAQVVMFVMDIPEKFRQLREAVVSRVVETVNAVGQWFSELPLRAQIWFSQLWTTVTNWVTQTAYSIYNTLANIPLRVGNFFRDTWNQASTATSNGVNNLMSFVRSIPGRVRDALSGAGSWLYQTGRDIIHGLINGISSAIGAAIDAVKRAVNGIIDGAKRAVGAHSPSTKFRDEVGRWIPPGIAEGIKAEMPALERYLGSALDNLVASVSATRTINVAPPAVSVAAPAVYASFEVDGEKIPINPKRASATAAEGDRRRGYINTGRTAVA